jgi:glucose-6-phosphate 1-epimerase
MDTTALEAMQRRFGIDDAVKFTQGQGGLPCVEIRNRFGSSLIALQGAQLLRWTPAGHEPVVWLSPKAKYLAGKSARGGIPVCWPWFGPHASESNFPAHGFARGAMWEVLEATALENGGHRLAFRLIRADDDARQWPHAASPELQFTLGQSLEIKLSTRNDGTTPFKLAEALHTYFAVGDVRSVSITGLDGTSYLDRVGAAQLRRQAGPVTIAGEVDRLYTGTASPCVIEDPSLKRRIRIEKRGSQSTVVWNPGEAKAAAMGDFEDNGYLRMLCVESANAGDDTVSVQPGETHALWVRYSVEPLS